MEAKANLEEALAFFEKATVEEVQAVTGCRIQLFTPNPTGWGTPSPAGWGEPDLERAAKEQKDITWHLRSALAIVNSHETEK